MKDIRIGIGYDLHRFVHGRVLMIGGVHIPHTHGGEGHSDADVLLHALCDALLGALAMGDIGQHFPDTDPKYKDIDSRKLLQAVYAKVQAAGYMLMNMDAVLCMEAPKIAPFAQRIRQQIADLLATKIEHISVKATTGEKIGCIGRHEGLSAQVVVLLIKT